jgi:hypothetical protein
MKSVIEPSTVRLLVFAKRWSLMAWTAESICASGDVECAKHRDQLRSRAALARWWRSLAGTMTGSSDGALVQRGGRLRPTLMWPHEPVASAVVDATASPSSVGVPSRFSSGNCYTAIAYMFERPMCCITPEFSCKPHK